MDNASNVTGYIDYFRKLAVRHRDIGHNPLSETPDGPAGECRFSRWSVDEVVSKRLRTAVSFETAGLLIELYETDIASSSAFDTKVRPRGAFTVLRNVPQSDFALEDEAYAITERIVYELLQQIWLDHYGPEATRCTTPFKQFYFDRLNITAVGPLFQNEFGWRVEFDLDFRQTYRITQAPAAGVFQSAPDAQS